VYLSLNRLNMSFSKQFYIFARILLGQSPTGPSSDELDMNIQRTSLVLLFSHWNGYTHFQSGLNWFRK
jgi:hypothetical protein